MAGRLLLRESSPSTGLRKVGAGGLVTTTVAGLWLLLGDPASGGFGPAAGLFVLGSLVTLAAAVLHYFHASLAICMVGVAMAGASLTTTLAVARGFEREITRQLTRINGHLLVTKYGLDFFEYPAVAKRVLADPRVLAASPFAYATVALVRENPEGEEAVAHEDTPRPTVVIAKGLDPNWAAKMQGLPTLFDRGNLEGLRPGDTRHVPGIVLGHRVATRLGVEVGDRVRLVVPAEIDGASGPDTPPRHASFEVLDRLRSGTAEIDDNLALVHLTAAQALFFREGRVTGIEFELADPAAVDRVVADLEDQLRAPYRMTTWKRTHGAFLVVLRQIRMALTLVLGLMVLVAASSVVTSLLLLVRRKRFEIGALAGLGADRRAVFWVFETVGVATGVIGALGGLVLGAAYGAVLAVVRMPLASDVYPIDHLPIAPGPVDALGPAVLAVALCALASGPVAARAAGIRPWLSLRG